MTMLHNTAAFNATPEPHRKPHKGDVIGWRVIDAETGEECVRCVSRAEARALAAECGGRTAKLVVD